jgi:serine/threonine protein kinase
MGTVYLADDLKLRRRVALKFISERYANDDEMRARFIYEAQTAAALNHPSIVPIHEVSEHQGRPFFAMEYVEGNSLKSLIASNEFSWEQIVDIATQICEGLEVAHSRGVIHGDIKPANILLDANNRVRLVDFGLATTVAADQMIPSESTLGTIAYASPEQLQGEALSPASDLFSLGAVLYQMITGELPFKERYEAAMTHAVINVTPPLLSSVRHNVPPLLEKIVTRLMEKRPANRYQSVAEAQADIADFSSEVNRQDEHARTGTARVKRFRFAVPLVLAVAALILGLNWLAAYLGDVRAARRAIAILPFENLGLPEDEYFSDGMTDAITMHLARFGDLSVISRSSSMQYKRTTKSLRDIGEDLGADYLLTGTIQWDKAGEADRIRISTSLVRAEDGNYLWADTYDTLLEQVFPLQSEIARRVTRALKVAVSDVGEGSLAAIPTSNLEAYDLYLRGNEYFNRGWDLDNVLFAIELYEQAITLDTEFAAAHAMLSRGHSKMYTEHYDLSAQRLHAGRAAAQSALDLSPDLPEAHLGLGYCHYAALAYDSALSEFAIVQDLEPNNRDLYSAIADVQRRRGQFGPALINSLRALELDPRSYRRGFEVGLTYGLMYDYDQAREYLRRTILLAPDWPLPYLFRAWIPILENGDVEEAHSLLEAAAGRVDLSTSKYYWWLLRVLEANPADALVKARPGSDPAGYCLHRTDIYRLMGNHDLEYEYADSARSLLESQQERQRGQPLFHGQLGLAYAGLRQREEALANARLAVELLPRTREAWDAQFLVVNLAKVLMIFGEYEAAIEQVDLLLSIPGLITIPYLKLDPIWAPLREYPRFQELLQTES